MSNDIRCIFVLRKCNLWRLFCDTFDVEGDNVTSKRRKLRSERRRRQWWEDWRKCQYGIRLTNYNSVIQLQILWTMYWTELPWTEGHITNSEELILILREYASFSCSSVLFLLALKFFCDGKISKKLPDKIRDYLQVKHDCALVQWCR